MFKKLLLILLVTPTLVLANAKEKNQVWVPFQGGSYEPHCRALFTLYDKYFHTETVINVKPGANGLIAINEMLAAPKTQNRILCSTSSLAVYNEFVNKDVDFKTKQIRVLLMTVNQSLTWFAPNSNRAGSNLKDQVAYWKSLGRPINVGYNFATAETIVKYLASMPGLRINPVPFKTAPQMLPSLRDGSLDLAINGHIGNDLAEQGAFRMIGYTDPFTWTGAPKGVNNFAVNDPVLSKISAWWSISVPEDTPDVYAKQLTDRIAFIYGLPEFKQPVGSANRIVLLKGKELQNEISQQRQLVKTYWP